MWRQIIDNMATVYAILTVVFILGISDVHGQYDKNCRADLCFVMDESGSIGRNNWKLSTDFVAAFVEQLDIGVTATTVGVVKFSSSASLHIKLNSHSTKQPLVNAINNLPYSGGGTSIHAGLQVARQECFKAENGDRPEEYAPNIMILMTDGQSSRAAAEAEADLARQQGITLVAIGIGGYDLTTLQAIASADNVYTFENFQALLDDVSIILGRSCQTIKACESGQLLTESDDYPNMEKCPYLHDPELRDKTYIEFKCEIFYNETLVEDDDRYKVTFLIGEEEVVSIIISPPSTYVNMEEKYLNQRMNKYVSCQVESYFASSPNLISPAIKSRRYFAGIVPSDKLVQLHEGDGGEKNILYFFSTLPIPCSSSSEIGKCPLNLDIYATSNRFVMYQANTADFTQIHVCRFRLYYNDWKKNESLAYNPAAPLQLLVRSDAFVSTIPEVSTMTVRTNAGPKPDGSLGAFSDYVVDTIDMVVYDQLSSTCLIRTDPWVSPFDRFQRYGMMQQGCFKAVVSDVRKFEIQVQTFPCSSNGGSGCSVACGVVVREGKYVMAVQRCNEQGIVYPLTLNQNGLDLNDINSGSKGMRIETNPSRTELMIMTPHVKVMISAQRLRGIDIRIKISRYYAGVRGLCGIYDGDATNDLTPNGQSSPIASASDYTQLNGFIESYRIGCAVSLFERSITDTQDEDDNFEEKFCDCDGNHNRTSGQIDGADCGLSALQDPVPVSDPREFVRPLIPRSILKSSKRRRKRQTGADPDLPTDSVIDYTPSVYPETTENGAAPPWTTGNTELAARATCQAAIDSSPVNTLCQNLKSTTEYTEMFETCVEDIQRTGTSEQWSAATAVEYRSACIDMLTSSNVTARNSTDFTDLLNQLQVISDVVCPRDCSGVGQCVAGRCICTGAYIGKDCSVLRSEKPVISGYLNNDNECDTQKSLCRAVRVTVQGVTNSDTLVCRLTIIKSSGSTVLILPGVLEFSNIVRCTLPTPAAVAGVEAHFEFNVAVSNDGVLFSDPVPGTRRVTNSKCVDCGSGVCSQKPGTCVIDGDCYTTGEEVDACSVCDSNNNQIARTAKPNGVCQLYGSWSAWSDWTNCSKPCDYGLTTRERNCLTTSCSGLNNETKLCNDFNCPADSSDEGEGIIYQFQRLPTIPLVEKQLEIRAFVVDRLNSYCVQRPAECCMGVSLLIRTNPVGFYAMFTLANVKEASGSPTVVGTDIIRLKLLVEVDIVDWINVCVLPSSNTVRRRKRAVASDVRPVSRALLNAALSPSNPDLAKMVNGEVTLVGESEAETMPPGQSGVSSNPSVLLAAIGGSLGAIFLIIIIVLVVLKLKRDWRMAKNKSIEEALRRRTMLAPSRWLGQYGGSQSPRGDYALPYRPYSSPYSQYDSLYWPYAPSNENFGRIVTNIPNSGGPFRYRLTM